MNAPFGVYLHIPFCASRCDYCAFATWTDRHHLIDAYVDAVRTDVERAVANGLARASTVFVGGGTPTQVAAERLADVISAIPTAADAEVTVECNPDDVTVELLRVYRDAGVTRVSVGVQSMRPHVLASLGRTHGPESVERTVAAVREVGLPTFNVDLIYGAAGERLDDWEYTLDRILGLDPPHVSAYGLTVEPGTPLAQRPDRHPDDDHQADEYEIADVRLTAAGLANYEISNWARPGHESEHNRLYWNQHDYRGFGCAAHSHRDGRRWWNVRTPERYIDLVRGGHPTEAAGENLAEDVRRLEGRQLALRTRDGVDAGAFDRDDLNRLGDLVAVHPDDGRRVVLTRRGRLLANEISTLLSDA